MAVSSLGGGDIHNLHALVVGSHRVDVAVFDVVVDVDRAGGQIAVHAREGAAHKEGVGDHHLPRRGQPRALVDGVVLLLRLQVNQALHAVEAKQQPWCYSKVALSYGRRSKY